MKNISRSCFSSFSFEITVLFIFNTYVYLSRCIYNKQSLLKYEYNLKVFARIFQGTELAKKKPDWESLRILDFVLKVCLVEAEAIVLTTTELRAFLKIKLGTPSWNIHAEYISLRRLDISKSWLLQCSYWTRFIYVCWTIKVRCWNKLQGMRAMVDVEQLSSNCLRLFCRLDTPLYF